MAEDDVYSEKTDDEEEFKAETFLYLKKHHHYKDPCYALVVAESAGCLTELFESEETAYLAEYDSLSKQISKQIEINDKDQFASFIVQNYYKLKAFPASEVLARLCKKCATACVTAFLDSQLHIYVDLNEKYKGISTPCLPLEHAAGGLSYSLTHLLLCRGAIAKDVVLEKALFAFRYHDYVIGWISRQQTYFKLIELLGSPELEEPLNVIKLLASHIEQPKIFDLCLSYIVLGDIIKLGALLFVSWDRLLVPSPDLENTPIVQFILRELAPQLELYMNDEENFVNAFNVIGILRHQRMLKHEAPRDITYAGPWGVSSDIADCLLLKLTYESEVLSRKIFSKKQMLSGSTSRSYVGVQKPAFGSGFQFSLQMSVPPTHTSPNRLAIYHDIVNQKSNTTLMKSSSRNVFTLARAHAPLLRIVKRIIK